MARKGTISDSKGKWSKVLKGGIVTFLNEINCYDTTGSPNGKSVCEVLERSLGMTLSRVDLVLSVHVRSVW